MQIAPLLLTLRLRKEICSCLSFCDKDVNIKLIMKRIQTIFQILAVVVLAFVGAAGLSAQSAKDANIFGDIVQMDKTIHNFGDIMTTDGPVKAVFTAKNISKAPMVIHNVVSSCGCTDVEWTRQPIKPGESGTINATYKNEDGAYPFDKALTVYVSGVKQPIILRLRGEVHEKELTLADKYPVHFGDLGFKSVDISCGNLTQGKRKGGEVLVANIGTKPIDVRFEDVSECLALELAPNPIPVGETARLIYTVTTDRNHWGRNHYYAAPVIDGKKHKAEVVLPANRKAAPAGSDYMLSDPDPYIGKGKEMIAVVGTTREDFLSWSNSQMDNGSNPIADQSTFALGKVKAGTKVKGSFTITNTGRSPFKLYKVDTETRRIVTSSFSELAAGSKGVLQFTLDTEGMSKGEHVVLLMLTTNSPLRPIMNLFVTCLVE